MLPDGTLSRFWGRFVFAFVRTFEQRRYSVVLDMADAPDPSTVLEAQGYVVVGTRPPAHLSGDDVAFGQLLVAQGIDTGDGFLPSVTFEHDYPRIAAELVQRLGDVREVWVVPRDGEHVYVQRLLAELAALRPVRTQALADLGDVPSDVAVVSFSDDGAGVRRALGQVPAEVPFVVQAEAFAAARPVLFLDLQGSACGELIATAVADVLAGGDGARIELPHEWSST